MFVLLNLVFGEDWNEVICPQLDRISQKNSTSFKEIKSFLWYEGELRVYELIETVK